MAQPESSSRPQSRAAQRRDGASQSRTRLQDRYRAWVRHHRLSAADSLYRLLHSPWSSLLTWLVIGVALALPVGLSVALDNARQLGDNLDSPVQLSLFLAPEVPLEDARQLELQIAALAQVDSTVLVSSDAALAEFQQMSGFGDVLESLEENPLPHLILAAPVDDIDPVAAGELRARLQQMPAVARAVLDMEWLQRLNGLMALWQRLVLAIAALLVLGVLLVLGNSIRLAIENRRDEIVIVKLVGGTNAFVRRPFLYTGLWYGIGGGLVAALAVTGSLAYLSGPVSNLVSLYSSEFQLRGLGLFGAAQLVLGGGLLGLLGSALAVSRHLGEIEPR
jgi:cell division transport system permease protein